MERDAKGREREARTACVDESEKGRLAYADSIGHPFFHFLSPTGSFSLSCSSVLFVFGQAGCRCIDMKMKIILARLDRNSGGGGSKIVCVVCMMCTSG